MKKRLIALMCIGVLGVACLSGCGNSQLPASGNNGTIEGEIALEDGSLDMSEGNEDLDNKEDPQTIEPFTMFFSGDIMLKAAALSNYDNQGVSAVMSDDLLYEMQNADLCMINQEFPFGVGGTQAPDKQFTFKVDPKYTQVFLDMGVDIVSLANNHTLDFGQDVLSQTFVALDEAGIDYVGAGKTIERAKAWESYEINGAKVAVLAASRVIPVVDWNVYNSQPGLFCTYDPAPLLEQIALADAEHDLTVVYVHWGIELAEHPEEYQRTMAKQYIDAGADVVIGSHPHVIQGVEYYNGVPIVYSLGNYIFNDTNRPTAAVKLHVDENKQLALQMLPVTSAGFQTYLMEGTKASELLNYIEEISYDVSIDEEGYTSALMHN